MVDSVITIITGVVATILGVVNWKTGRDARGKFARAIGDLNYEMVQMVILAMIFYGVVAGNALVNRAGLVFQALIALDNFFNGNDPPSKRRRAWVKNKFAKLAPVASK